MISAESYEEVYKILSYMNKAKVMKIPEEILKTINNNRNPSFKTKINKNDIFNESNVSKEAIDILCYLEYHYWMDSNRKKQIDFLHRKKIQELEEDKKRKFNSNDIFEKKKNDL